jgi:hypothetical protein
VEAVVARGYNFVGTWEVEVVMVEEVVAVAEEEVVLVVDKEVAEMEVEAEEIGHHTKYHKDMIRT